MSSARRVRSLLRSLLRAERKWPKADERLYIQEQIVHLRHEARRLQESPQTLEMLDDAEKRLEVALHYGIAYQKVAYMSNYTHFNRNNPNLAASLRTVID